MPRVPRTTSVIRVDEQKSDPVPVRRRLRVGAADDHAEAHADQLAQQALGIAASYAPQIRRSGGVGLAGELDLDPAALDRASGSPQRLDNSTAERMGAGFGQDFSGVKVHTGSAAASLAADMGARAFTRGQDIYFGTGEFQPGTGEGDRVLSHELAHTVQNSSEVHRFPAGWINQPVQWSAQTQNVIRPGGGVSGGVYILQSAQGNGPINTAVVKPTFGKNAAGDEESGAQIVAADRIIASFGLTAPASRLVRKGTPEFNDLVALCSPRQPAQPAQGQPGHDNWKPLAAADDLVVMSEIQNARTLNDIAEDAGQTDVGRSDLVHLLNDPQILHDLGLTMVADMVVGNSDRFLSDTKNLGNLMVSVLNGQRTLNVFDTTAFLPDGISAQKVIGQALVKSGVNLTFSAKNPATLLDEALGAIVQVVRTHEPQPLPGQMGPPPRPFSDRLESAIASARPRLLGHFMQGWNAGVAHALHLSTGNNADQALGDLAGEKNVSAGTLKSTATYVGMSGGAATTKDASTAAAAVLLPEWVRKLDLTKLSPDGGIVDPSVWAKVPSDALKAEWVDNQWLPTVAQVTGVLNGNDFDQPAYRTLKYNLGQAHQTVDATLGQKTRMFKSMPRNRAVLGHAVVNAQAITAGMLSLKASTRRLKFAAEGLAGLVPSALSLSKADAQEVLQKVTTVHAMVGAAEGSRNKYVPALAQASASIDRTAYPEKAALVAALDAAGDTATIDSAVQTAKDKKLNDLVTALKVRRAQP